MGSFAKMTKTKNINGMKSLLNYVLGLDRKSEVVDETRHIEWERWNTPVKSASELVDWWCGHVEASNQRHRQLCRRGRPRVATGYHFIYNYNFPEEYFQLYRMGVWDFVENSRHQDLKMRDFPGIIAYHFSNRKFHVHMVINPISADGSNSFFRVGIGDVWWKNDLYLYVRDAINIGSLEVAVKLGYAEPGTYAVTIDHAADAAEKPDDDDKPSVLEYLRRTNDGVYREIREARGVATF